MDEGDGFTADLVDRLCGVDGVYGLWISSWPGVAPLLLTSIRTDTARVFEVVAEHWRSQRSPLVRSVAYDDREVSLEDRIRPALEVVDRASAEGVRVDVVYPVTGYDRVYVELAHDPDHVSPQPARILRHASAKVAPGGWPIEVRERPWSDAYWNLIDPPPGWRGPAPLLDRAPAWVEDALDRVYQGLFRVVGPSASVEWSRGEGYPHGRIHGGWSDGPLLSEVAERSGVSRAARGHEITVEGGTIPVVLVRGLTYGFQLAAIEAHPDLLLDDFPFQRIVTSVPASSLDPGLVAAWAAMIREQPLRNLFDKEVIRAYLARHRDEVARRMGEG